MKEENTIIEVAENKAIQVNPYDKMVEMALSLDVGIEKLKKLLELKERHEKNEARKAYHFAMSELKKETITIIKDKQGHNNTFASLANILDVMTPLLGKQGLTLSWKTKQNIEKKLVTVTAIITHSMGYSEQTSLSSGLELSGKKSDIHGLASAISYLERYTAKAILGVAEKDQDNDAETVNQKLVSEEQIANLESLIEETKTDLKDFLKIGNLKRLSDMWESNYNGSVGMLEAKRSEL